MADQSAGFTGNIPEVYDRHLGPVLFHAYGVDLTRRVAAGRPARILETAAGTGIVTRILADALPDARITATDLNPPMIDVARSRFRPGGPVSFQPADATALPFTDASFDVLACQFGVMFYPDKDKSYREAFRVLSPGGRYVFNVWDSHERNPFAALVARLLRTHFPADPPPFYDVPFHYHRLDPMKASLEAAGFTNIRLAILPRNDEVADLAGFARGLIFGIPLVDQLRSRGADPEALRAELLADLSPLFGDPPRASLQAIVVEAEKPRA